MSNTLEIPLDLIPDVREALSGMLGEGTESISHELTRPERELHPEWFVAGRVDFERACALLDVLGWNGSLRPLSTNIDLDAHGVTLRDARERWLGLVESQLVEDAVDAKPALHPSASPGRRDRPRRVVALRDFIYELQRRLRP